MRKVGCLLLLACGFVLAQELPVTTSSPEARRAFAGGLSYVFGFDHERAAECFARVAEIDPSCAMAYWGQALSVGPNINNPAMEAEATKAAVEGATKAASLSAKASPLEAALIGALAKRYAMPPPEDRKPLDRAYAEAMRAVWVAHRDSPDVGALFAESLMDLRPWDLWTPDGKPQPGTEEIVSVLEEVLAKHPGHQGANHYYIHTMEASPTPGKALDAANRLRALAGATSHLVHMPAHIDQRLGHYADSIAANECAVAIDRRNVAEGKGLGFYTVYRAHNFHFLAWSAMYAGERAKALGAAREMVAAVPEDLVAAYPDFIEGFLGAPYCVLVRFGMWKEILDEPAPPANHPASNAFWRYARAVALSALGRVDEAAAEQAAFLAAEKAVPETATIGNNTVKACLEIARSMVEGEILYRKGEFDAAFARLREGVAREDALRYDEPWGWMMPVRHALGALLLEQGRIADAQKAYEEDLERHPENGWSLHGLAECLRRSGHPEEAVAAQARFEKAWAKADIKLRSSCFCRTGA